ncbi:MAG TPA: ribonuclease HII [Arcobacter sp.]|jgi:ribonuclease HII|nr:ribonuclease HII [Arcobacter sp.]
MRQTKFEFDSFNFSDLCGIDEAGRGPWAGSMSVAGVRFKKDITNIKELDILNDSKKLSEKKRELLFNIIKEVSDYHIVIIDNKEIDSLGISQCLKNAINEIINNIKADEYLMDGNTSFGIKNLKHLIKADGKIPEVSAASILAKVSRDRAMIDMGKQYPQYEFHKHKGYGTKAHLEAIKKYGKCELHRMSYKIKALEK